MILSHPKRSITNGLPVPAPGCWTRVGRSPLGAILLLLQLGEHQKTRLFPFSHVNPAWIASIDLLTGGVPANSAAIAFYKVDSDWMFIRDHSWFLSLILLVVDLCWSHSVSMCIFLVFCFQIMSNSMNKLVNYDWAGILMMPHHAFCIAFSCLARLFIFGWGLVNRCPSSCSCFC